MNPWLLAGCLAAVIAAGLAGEWHGTKTGRDAERASWQAKESKELAEANGKILQLEEGARLAERRKAAEFAEIDQRHTQEIQNAHRQKELDIAAARAGRVILRIPATCEDPGERDPRDLATAPGVGHGASTAELPREVAADLLGLADDADEVVLQLTACQSVVRADRAPQPPHPEN